MGYEDDILAGLYASSAPTFEAKLTQPSVGTPPGLDVPPTFADRLTGSARRLAANPVMQDLAAVANPNLANGLRLINPARNPVSFERDNVTVTSPGGPMARLTPVEPGATADTDVPAAPTLDPRYELRKPGMLAGPGGMSVNLGPNPKAAWDASRQKLLDDYDTDKHLQYVQGANKADQISGTAGLMEEEARIKQRHAELQQKADDDAARKHEAFLQRNQQLADEIAEKKTTIEQVVGDSVGDIGMVLGGMLLARAGHMDQAMAQFNKRMDQAIQRQQMEIENKKVKLQARQSVFGQMLQETGDRRLAALATRNLMLEAAKQKLGADAERLGIPTVKTAAEQAVNKIQHDQDQLQEAINREGYQTYLANARAAAGAQAAAEAQARKRMLEDREYQLKVAELGVKATEAEAKRTEAGGKSNVDFENRVQSLGKEMADKDLAEGRSAVENAKRRLMGKPEDEGLPGVGPGADLRDKIAPRPTGAAALNPGAWALYGAAGLDDKERVSRGDWDKVKLSYQKQITGSGASEKEREMISKAFEGAKSPAEQRAAIANADAFFQQLERRKMAAYPENVQEEFKRRLAGQGAPKK